MIDYAHYVEYEYDREALYALIHPIKFHTHQPITSFDDRTRHSIVDILQWEGEFIGRYYPHITVASLEPGAQVNIHIDSDYEGTPTQRALNLPITKCDGVFMHWYTIKKGRTEKTLRSARGYELRGLAREDADRVFTLDCSLPAVVNPTIFHDIQNLSSVQQLIISVRG